MEYPQLVNKIFQLREDYHNNLRQSSQFFVAPIHILREKRSNKEFFWCEYSKITPYWSEYRKSSICGHFSRSDSFFFRTESLLYLDRKMC